MAPLFHSIESFLTSVPWLWIALWLGIAGLAITLMVLMLTRWGQSDPMRKCVVLALLAHLLLAGYATTVQIVASSGSPGDRSPITMVLIDMPVDEAVAPEAPTEAPEVKPETIEVETPVDPEFPDDATQQNWTVGPSEPTPQAGHEPVARTPSRPTRETVRKPTASPRVELPRIDTAPQSLDVVSPQQILPSPPIANSAEIRQPRPRAERQRPRVEIEAVARPLASAYRSREPEQRQAMLKKHGGNQDTEAAVAAAIAWLAKVQRKDGGWDASGFGAGKEQKIAGEDRESAGVDADTGVTGLAILAILGAGHSHKHGPYAETISKGLEYLKRIQGKDGNLYGNAGSFARMYCHAMATFALSEAYAMTRDRKLRPVVEKAVAFCVKSQNPATGGWRYRPGATGDTSQLGWQLMALRSAKMAGIKVPEVVLQRSAKFLRSVASGRAGGLASYRPSQRHQPTRTMTAEALFCRQLLELERQAGANTEAGQYLLQTLPGEMLPGERRPNFYYWYYGTVSMFQLQGVYWRQWNPALKNALLKSQNEDGSWPIATRWGGYGGQIYTTAMGAMCLEVYYRYLPFYGDGKRVARSRW